MLCARGLIHMYIVELRGLYYIDYKFVEFCVIYLYY